ncbi:MAG: UvrD-helicase domain-containing protein [Acidobacteria bacterium]|nr:UvrD-helicase domain-containing protein [Acidobacteriota bacterium]
MQLDHHQTIAATHGNGPLLIIAGPGSGKTRTITHRIAWLIQQGVLPEQILAVTFTNKAGREMRERIGSLTDAQNLTAPITAKTFHSWCVQILRSNIHTLGRNFDSHFSIYDQDDQVKAYKVVIQALNLDPKRFVASEYQSKFSYAKNQSLNPRNYLASLKYVREEDKHTTLAIFDDYHKLLEENNALDFDDLLLLSVAALSRDTTLRKWYHELYKHILVDEYQDTNKAQNALIRLLVYGGDNPATFDWAGRSLTGVGDDGQGIFSFRGAIPENMLSFPKQFPGTVITKLEENYRSTRQITSLANQLIAQNINQLPKNLFSKREGKPVNVVEFATSYQEADWIASRVAKHLNHFPSSPIFIIYRTNAMSRSFEMALRRLRVPYQLVGGLSFYERKEIKDMVAYLRVIHNPADSLACRRIINTPARGIGETTITKLNEIAEDEDLSLWEVCEMADAISRHIKINTKTLAGIKAFQEAISTLRQIQPLKELVRQTMMQSGYEQSLNESGKEEDLERLENLGELLNAAAEAEAEGLSLGEFLDRASLHADSDKIGPEQVNAALVSLITAHTVKGLEAHTCFLPGWEEGILPHARSLESEADIEEERRVAYVAMTRPAEYLYITHTKKRMLYGAEYDMCPSRFLADIQDPEIRFHSQAHSLAA